MFSQEWLMKKNFFCFFCLFVFLFNLFFVIFNTSDILDLNIAMTP